MNRKIITYMILVLLSSCKTKQQITEVKDENKALSSVKIETEEQDSLPQTFIDSLKAGYRVPTGIPGDYYRIVDSVPLIVKKMFPDLTFYYEINGYNGSRILFTYFNGRHTNPSSQFNTLLQETTQEFSLEEKITCFIIISEYFEVNINSLKLNGKQEPIENKDFVTSKQKGKMNLNNEEVEIVVYFYKEHFVQVNFSNKRYSSFSNSFFKKIK